MEVAFEALTESLAKTTTFASTANWRDIAKYVFLFNLLGIRRFLISSYLIL